MVKDVAQLNSECHKELDNQHLCYIRSQGFHLSDEQEYKAIVEHSKYKCDHCGYTAKSDANLCVPTPL